MGGAVLLALVLHTDDFTNFGPKMLEKISKIITIPLFRRIFKRTCKIMEQHTHQQSAQGIRDSSQGHQRKSNVSSNCEVLKAMQSKYSYHSQTVINPQRGEAKPTNTAEATSNPFLRTERTNAAQNNGLSALLKNFLLSVLPSSSAAKQERPIGIFQLAPERVQPNAAHKAAPQSAYFQNPNPHATQNYRFKP